MNHKIEKISIIIPVFNELKTIDKILSSVRNVDVGAEKEVIIVDDFSIDGTRELLGRVGHDYKIVYNDKNMGKGASLRKGFTIATGDAVIIQDADLEYDPQDYPRLLRPLREGDADVVYGSRFMGVRAKPKKFDWHFFTNKFLTVTSNIFSGLKLTDMETCYKVFTAEAIRKISPHLSSNRFGIEPEITAQISKHKLRICEVSVSYNARNYEQGKKITWRDGIAALWHIIKFNLFVGK